MQMVVGKLVVCGAILLSGSVASAAPAAPAAKPITVTGQINGCYKLKTPLVRLRAILPFNNKHASSVVPVRPDGHFTIQGTSADLPNGRYQVQIGEDAGDLPASESMVDIRGASVDAGIVGDCDKDSDE